MTPAPQPMSSTLPFMCFSSVDSSSELPTSAVAAEHARQRFHFQIVQLIAVPPVVQVELGLRVRAADTGRSGARCRFSPA